MSMLLGTCSSPRRAPRPQCCRQRRRCAARASAPPFSAADFGAEEPRLSHAGRASVLTGLYIGAVGLLLLVRPTWPPLRLLFVEPLAPLFARVFGLLCATFSYYYLGCGLAELRGEAPPVAFYRATVGGRVLLALALLGLFASGGGTSPGLLALGALNGAGAGAMAVAMRADAFAEWRARQLGGGGGGGDRGNEQQYPPPPPPPRPPQGPPRGLAASAR